MWVKWFWSCEWSHFSECSKTYLSWLESTAKYSLRMLACWLLSSHIWREIFRVFMVTSLILRLEFLRMVEVELFHYPFKELFFPTCKMNVRCPWILSVINLISSWYSRNKLWKESSDTTNSEPMMRYNQEKFHFNHSTKLQMACQEIFLHEEDNVPFLDSNTVFAFCML